MGGTQSTTKSFQGVLHDLLPTVLVDIVAAYIGPFLDPQIVRRCHNPRMWNELHSGFSGERGIVAGSHGDAATYIISETGTLSRMWVSMGVFVGRGLIGYNAVSDEFSCSVVPDECSTGPDECSHHDELQWAKSTSYFGQIQRKKIRCPVRMVATDGSRHLYLVPQDQKERMFQLQYNVNADMWTRTNWRVQPTTTNEFVHITNIAADLEHLYVVHTVGTQYYIATIQSNNGHIRATYLLDTSYPVAICVNTHHNYLLVSKGDRKLPIVDIFTPLLHFVARMSLPVWLKQMVSKHDRLYGIQWDDRTMICILNFEPTGVGRCRRQQRQKSSPGCATMSCLK